MFFHPTPDRWEGSHGYSMLAMTFVETGTFSTASRPPLYPVFLAAIIRVAGKNWLWPAILAQSGLSLICGTMLVWFCVRCLRNPLAAWLMALLYASHIHLNIENLAQRETVLFCVLFVLLLFALYRARGSRGYAATGAIAGLLYLTRPTGTVVLAMLMLILLYQWRRIPPRKLVGAGASLLLAFFVVTLPWNLLVLRNFGDVRLLPSSTNGENLFKGNTPALDGIYPYVDVDLYNPWIADFTA